MLNWKQLQPLLQRTKKICQHVGTCRVVFQPVWAYSEAAERPQSCDYEFRFSVIEFHRIRMLRISSRIYSIEKHGFANAAQAIKDKASRCPARPDAVEGNGGTFDDLVTAGQFRRR